MFGIPLGPSQTNKKFEKQTFEHMSTVSNLCLKFMFFVIFVHFELYLEGSGFFLSFVLKCLHSLSFKSIHQRLVFQTILFFV